MPGAGPAPPRHRASRRPPRPAARPAARTGSAGSAPGVPSTPNREPGMSRTPACSARWVNGGRQRRVQLGPSRTGRRPAGSAASRGSSRASAASSASRRSRSSARRRARICVESREQRQRATADPAPSRPCRSGPHRGQPGHDVGVGPDPAHPQPAPDRLGQRSEADHGRVEGGLAAASAPAPKPRSTNDSSTTTVRAGPAGGAQHARPAARCRSARRSGCGSPGSGRPVGVNSARSVPVSAVDVPAAAGRQRHRHAPGRRAPGSRPARPGRSAAR